MTERGFSVQKWIALSAIAAMCGGLFVGPVFADTAQTPHFETEALIQRAASVAERFTVRIETVGGVQPPERGRSVAPTVDPGEDGEEPPKASPPPNRFRDDPGSSFLLADGPTTGIVYSADGYILTSSFNFVRQPAIITVKLPDGRQLPARIVGRDQVRKLALLKVDANNLPVPTWTSRPEIRPGQWAIALGCGYGGSETLLSVGIVSAVNRMMGNAIQTDAKLSPANYGGPLLDSAGRVLGICVPMAQRPGELAGIEFYDSGIGFAVPGWRVHEIVADLMKGKTFRRGWLGIAIDRRITKGVRIYRLADPSPLRAAGAMPGDYIATINGQPIKHFGQLQTNLYMLPAGTMVRVRLLRGAEFLDFDVILAAAGEMGDFPESEAPPESPGPAGANPGGGSHKRQP